MANPLTKLLRALPAVKRGGDESLAIELKLPAPSGGPWLSLRATLHTSPTPQGLDARLAAHFSARPGALLSTPAAGGDARRLPGTKTRPPALARLLASPAVRAALAPLAGVKLEQWLDLRISDRPLDRGARALLPERLERLGPPRDPRGPALQGWIAELPGPLRGLAQVLTLAADLPAGRGGPLHMAATVVQAVEEDPTPRA